MKRGTVFPAWLDDGKCTGAFAWSLYGTSLISHQRFLLEAAGQRIESGPRLSGSRNTNAKTFIEHSEAEWFWSIDSDMKWQPNALEQLLATAHWKDRPIVGGWCYAEMQDGRIRPTIYRVHEGKIVNIEMPRDFKYDQPVLCDATGAAFVLIHRTVFEKIAAAHDSDNPHVWYQETTYGGQDIGEDITFCLRARAAGFPVLVDARIQVGHWKSWIMGHADYLAQVSAEEFMAAQEQVVEGIVVEEEEAE